MPSAPNFVVNVEPESVKNSATYLCFPSVTFFTDTNFIFYDHFHAVCKMNDAAKTLIFMSQQKISAQERRKLQVLSRVFAAKKIAKGFVVVEIESDDDCRNYEQLFLADSSFAFKQSRSGRIR